MLLPKKLLFFYCCCVLVPAICESIDYSNKCDVSKESEITIDLSLNSLEQDDPILIRAIQDRLIPPSSDTVPYNFTG